MLPHGKSPASAIKVSNVVMLSFTLCLERNVAEGNDRLAPVLSDLGVNDASTRATVGGPSNCQN